MEIVGELFLINSKLLLNFIEKFRKVKYQNKKSMKHFLQLPSHQSSSNHTHKTK